MVGADHEIHTQERGESQDIELTLFEEGIRTTHPLAALNQYNECAESENGLDDSYGTIGDIHTREGCSRCHRANVDEQVNQHQRTNNTIEPAARCLEGLAFGSGYRSYTRSCEQVGQQYNDKHSHERYLW